MLDKQIKVFTQFIMAFYDLHVRSPKDVKNSLTFFRVISLYRELRWIRNCISQNAYHQSIRELRFALDSIVQAYYVDERHHKSEMSCKLEIVKEIEGWGFGRKLIDRTKLKHKQDLKDLPHLEQEQPIACFGDIVILPSVRFVALALFPKSI